MRVDSELEDYKVDLIAGYKGLCIPCSFASKVYNAFVHHLHQG